MQKRILLVVISILLSFTYCFTTVFANEYDTYSIKGDQQGEGENTFYSDPNLPQPLTEPDMLYIEPEPEPEPEPESVLPSPDNIKKKDELNKYIDDYIEAKLNSLPPAPETFLIASKAGFFKAASIAKGSLGSFSGGEAVKVYESSMGWTKVKWGEKTGYVLTKLINFGAYDKNAIKLEALSKLKKLSSYKTKFSGNQLNRNHNIEKACFANTKAYNPGETASFNSNTGPSNTAATGYLLAGALQNGEPISAYGGGICQVSSTIYNAVDGASGIKITARKSHSARVNYVPVGRDATVSYGGVDFKFRNDRSTPVYVDCVCDHISHTVTVTVYGL